MDKDEVPSLAEAREQITGDSWLDNLARASLLAAEKKFSGPDDTPPGNPAA